MAKDLVSDEARRAIADKIAEVERRTAGEIVVHVVPRSSSYAALRLGYATLVAYLAVQALAWSVPDEHVVWIVSAFVPLALAFWLVLGVESIFSRLVPAALKHAEVHRRAVEAFVENRVHRTRDASGVLILVSFMEQRVEILADEGIHQRVGVAGWAKYIDGIVRSNRAGEVAKGLSEAIGQIGEELAAHFPPRADDTNELPNDVVVTAR